MNCRIPVIAIIIIPLLSACRREAPPAVSLEDPARYVNPFIGTSRMGHTYPGAVAPFGMVQLSPQTAFVPMYHEDGSYNRKTYEYCAGYQYADSMIIGFAHTAFSGTGHSDLGDVLLMPVTGDFDPTLLQNETGGPGYCSIFSHLTEEASPGYYKAILDDYGITAELTASERVGFHRYTFHEGTEAHVVLDLVYNIYHHNDKNVWTFVRVENDSLITGYRQTRGWARNRKVFFAIQFSRPFSSYGHVKYDQVLYDGFYRRFDQTRDFPEMAGNNIRAYFNFDIPKDDTLKVKVALSPVSTSGAINNLLEEIPHWDFERIRLETSEQWNKELSKIQVTTMTEEDRVTFYTALYHTMLSPIIYEDADGHYTGLDQNLHTSEGFSNYTIFSLWDTYRALHPLYNIIHQQRNSDMIRSMLEHYRQSVHHMLPVWSHYSNENWCMIGYHAVSVIADAMVKGVSGFDKELALEACKNTSNVRYFDGLGNYLDFHYVPDDKSHSSVSKTLELAYDDWCIAQVAHLCGDTSAEREYLRRSEYFMNVFDPASRFMRPRLSDGKFREDFDPLDTYGQGFIEGNAWNYGLYVPHQLYRMIAMMGGKEAFVKHLDSLFTMGLEDKYIEKHEDITRDGIMGSYVHGNEPGHHIPYLYNYAGAPYKTQERVRKIVEEMYGPGPDGLCGNDDAGQMSAWYIFSALGFYPVTPGSTVYALGSPLVREAKLTFENGNVLKITALNQSSENVYVKKVMLNGKEIKENTISHHDLMKGGELVFDMNKRP